MKIAIASTGLGHIARGVEAWAEDTAKGLAEHGIDVTLFSAADHATYDFEITLPCRRRFDPKTQRWADRLPNFLWRWGFKSGYGIEQISFWWHLWPFLQKNKFNILHVQDPILADWCRRFRRLGLVKAKEILGHGTEEPDWFLRRFDYLQQLAPWHLQQLQSKLEIGAKEKPLWTSVPNFVETTVFRPPATDADSQKRRTDFREKHGIPQDAVVFGCAAAIKKVHKRIDYLIREFAECFSDTSLQDSASAYLLIAGAHEEETDELLQSAENIGNGRIKILLNLPREEMPAFYNAADVFVLTSLFEMMPIAVLEALASGLPLVTNRHPVLEWMVGPGGETIDMSRDGKLAAFLEKITPEWIAEKGKLARQHALDNFSKHAVIEQYIEYYKAVLATKTE
jgi:1,2-diacylglycerol 3-alpha-glucosyltransferase